MITTLKLISMSRATAVPQNPTYTGATPPAVMNGNGNLVSFDGPNTPIHKSQNQSPVGLKAATFLFGTRLNPHLALREDLDSWLSIKRSLFILPYTPAMEPRFRL